MARIDTAIQLGEKYRDPVTGFEGTATGLHLYQYGCLRVSLEGQDKDGAPAEYAFDEQRLVEVRTDRQVQSSATAGGPRRTPPRRGYQ